MKNAVLILSACMIFGFAVEAQAAKKKSYKRENFTKAQQQEIFKRAVADCRKKLGPSYDHVEINYTFNRVQCWGRG